LELPPRIQDRVSAKAVHHEVPTKISQTLESHTKPVSCVKWSRPYGHLLASASMDQTVKIWDVFRSNKCARTLRHHKGAVRDIQWNFNSTQLISASFDKTVALTDVETGKCIHSYQHKEMLSAICYHPKQHNLFLVGGEKSGIACWDTNSNKVVTQYSGRLDKCNLWNLQQMESRLSQALMSQREIPRIKLSLFGTLKHQQLCPIRCILRRIPVHVSKFTQMASTLWHNQMAIILPFFRPQNHTN